MKTTTSLLLTDIWASEPEDSQRKPKDFKIIGLNLQKLSVSIIFEYNKRLN